MTKRGAWTPEDFGAAGQDDETEYVQAAINHSQDVFLTRFYRVSNVYFPRRGGKVLRGWGPMSGLIGIDPRKPVVQTYEPGQTDWTYYCGVRDFTIGGVGSCALAFAQTIGSTAENIYLSNARLDGRGVRFRGGDAFVFEETFANVVSGLRTEGAAFTGTPFKINACVLDTIFNLLYTSNFSDYLIDIDMYRREVAESNNAGFGSLQFNTPTLQGARKYSWRIKGGAIQINNAYTENNVGEALILEGHNIAFNSCGFMDQDASRTHTLWIEDGGPGNLQQVTFNNCRFTSHENVIGHCDGPIIFNDCWVLGGGDLFATLRKVPEAHAIGGVQTPSSMPVTIRQQPNGNRASEVVMKTTGLRWQFARLRMDSNGQPIGSTPEVPPDVTHGPY